MKRTRQRYRIGWVALAAVGLITAGGILAAAALNVLNGIQFRDASGTVLHAHGGGMIKVGSVYYWFGENRDGTNFVSAYRSTDLKNWTFRAHVLRRDMAPELASANIERPKVLYNAATNTYVLWAHKENGVDYSEARVAVATASNIEGPYTYRGSFRPLGFDSRDMTVFDDNGTAYSDLGDERERGPQYLPAHPDFLDVEALVRTLWPGQFREAPALFKRGQRLLPGHLRRHRLEPQSGQVRDGHAASPGRGARFRTSRTPRPTIHSRPSSSQCRAPRAHRISTWATAGRAPGAGRSTSRRTSGFL